jgi:hypothetical protein
VGAVPEFVPAAVNVTDVPAQIEVDPVEILILGVKVPLTVKVMPVEVAEVYDKQLGNVPPVVKLAFTTSPFAGI